MNSALTRLLHALAPIACLLLLTPAVSADDPAKSAPDAVEPKPDAKPTPKPAKAGRAAYGSLRIGDPAPAITVSKWLKGTPVRSFEKGSIYVVEFWATWCGPCLKSIPHLTSLQKEYATKKVRIIGVTSDEDGNRLPAVQAFVSKMGDEMDYTVAFDRGDDTYEAYMRPAARNSIPSAFLIDREGTIAWVGHPAGIDEPLKAMVADKWDAKAYAKTFNKRMEYESAKLTLAAAVKRKKDAEILEAAKSLLALYPQSAQVNNEVAWAVVNPASKLPIKNDSELFNFVYTAAVHADELDQGKTADVQETLARCRFIKGLKQEAIEAQEKAISLTLERDREPLQKTLREYQKKK